MSSWSYPTDLSLPWNNGVAEDVRFRRMLKHALGIFLVTAILFPFLPMVVVEKPEVKKERTQYTRLVIEEKKFVPPPPPVVKKPEPKVVKPKPAPKAKPKPKPVAKKVAPKPKPRPVDLTKQAREKAAKSGVLAFADDLAAMRQKVDVSKVKTSDLKRGAAQAKQSERKLLTAKAASSVGGIAAAKLSADTGGVALSGRETTIVEAAAEDVSGGSDEQYADTDYSGRSSESVRRVMDANKGTVFSIYNRALRKDASLAGKLMFTLTIEPSGVVSAVSLVSSELADEALVRKILARIRMINFGTEAVSQTTVNYSFDFLPY